MFQIKKDPTKWLVCGTGQGWERIPKVTEKVVFCLNDFIFAEKYGITPDIMCIMDVLDEKPQIVSGLNNLGEVVKRINEMGVPLVAPFKYEEIPLSEAFPLQEAVKNFGMPFFTNTICYMIAYALLHGAREIETYGVNQAGSHEYTEEKGGVEYWLGIANGMGVKVTIHGDKSQLMKFKGRYGHNIMYGYNQTYEQITVTEKKFGEPIIKSLSTQPQAYSRTIRKVR